MEVVSSSSLAAADNLMAGAIKSAKHLQQVRLLEKDTLNSADGTNSSLSLCKQLSGYQAAEQRHSRPKNGARNLGAVQGKQC